jgi:Rps23 Pro-64 3,4-dihydroxylase Tpa1-like proline 4-hydroxylase
VRRREAVRAVAVIYYLNNPQWQPGDGGETGLYRTVRDAIEHPVAVVPPLNNSLVAFECTPGSYHTFRSNVRHPRNSVVIWLHVEKSAAIARWGESALVRFS